MSAKVDKLVIAADTMTRDLKTQKIFLKGRVLLVFQGQNVRADAATIDTQKKTILAEGNLSLVGLTARAVGSRAEFNYETDTGVLYDAYVEKGSQVQLSGKVIRKLNQDEYEIEGGSFTACSTCPPAWNFAGSSIRATMGRYAYITHSVLYFGGLPVFYFPYLIVPIATERQTGFLFPSFGYGTSSKFVTSVPFFWAMSDSSDSTWTFENYQGRGQKGNLNYRYRLGPDSGGELNTTYIQDGAVGEQLRQSGARLDDTEKVQRSSIRYQHYYELPEGFVHRADINWASDTFYSRDFPNDIKGHGDPAMVSRTSVTKNTENQHISAEVVHNRNMTPADPRGADDSSIHRFPSLQYNLAPQQLAGNLLLDVEARYTNFARNGAAFDKLKTTSGVKNRPIEIDPNPTNPDRYESSTDLLRTGQRLTLEPRLSLPFNIGHYLDINPSISFRETDYEFGVGEQGSAYRRFFRGTISARTQFGRVFGGSAPGESKYKHEVQPELVYTSIPWIDSARHPFFGENDPFYQRDQAVGNDDIPQFDDFDRLYDRHVTTFNLTNYLIRKDPVGDTSTYSQLITFKLSQSYDNQEAGRVLSPGETREPWSPLSATLDVRLPYLNSNTIARYYHYDKITGISSRARFISPYNNFIEFSYTQDFQLKKNVTQDPLTSRFNTLTDINNYNQSLKTLVGYRSKYIGLAAFTTYNLVSQRYIDYGYVVDILPPGDCWLISFGEVRPSPESGGEPFYLFNIGFNYGSGMQSTSESSLSRFR